MSCRKQLRNSQRLETVGTLAGGIAHEFNNVLVPIILFTDMALQDLPETSSHAVIWNVCWRRRSVPRTW
jgi:signal transduction histidine kinase